jgi:hypothetical protein
MFAFGVKLSMYDWMAALSGHSFSTLKEFLDLCNYNDVCSIPRTLPIFMGEYNLVYFQ